MMWTAVSALGGPTIGDTMNKDSQRPLKEIAKMLGDAEPGSRQHTQMAAEIQRRQTETMTTHNRYTLCAVIISVVALVVAIFALFN